MWLSFVIARDGRRRMDAYQGTVLSRPIRTATARASESTIAQVSAERRGRLDISGAPEKRVAPTENDVGDAREIFGDGVQDAGGN
jgi:hypothetical protein